MNIKLVWVNRNVKPVTTKIYRLANPGDPLVTPIATLTANETTYTDNDIINGVTYYYVMSVSDGVSTLNTTPVKVLASYNTGPGPAYLKWGNLQYGYYGTVNYLDMFTRSEFLAQVGLAESSFGAAVANPIWDKWSRNGKTYFVPRTTMGIYMAASVYNVGCYFGTNDAGLFVPQNGTSTIQNKTISKNGFIFTPMCPTGANDLLYPDIVPPTGTDVFTVRSGSMVADFYYPTVSEVISPVQKIYRLQGSLTLTNTFATSVLTQNRLSNNILSAIGSTSVAIGSSGALEALTTIGQSSTASYRAILRLEQNPVTLG